MSSADIVTSFRTTIIYLVTLVLVIIAFMKCLGVWNSLRRQGVPLSFPGVLFLYLMFIDPVKVGHCYTALHRHGITEIKPKDIIAHIRSGGNPDTLALAVVTARHFGHTMTFKQAAAFSLMSKDIEGTIHHILEKRQLILPIPKSTAVFGGKKLHITFTGRLELAFSSATSQNTLEETITAYLHDKTLSRDEDTFTRSLKEHCEQTCPYWHIDSLRIVKAE